MSYVFVWIDGCRVEAHVAAAFLKLRGIFEAAFPGLTLKIRRGSATAAEQAKLFQERYVVAANVNGRKVYDTRSWLGRTWYRIDPSGTVATPGTSNHEIDGPNGPRSIDIHDTGADPGVTVRGTVRDLWMQEHASDSGFENEGYEFAEAWHKTYRGALTGPLPYQPTVASTDARPAEKPEEDPMPANTTVDYRKQTLKPGVDAYLEIDTAGHIAALAGPATVSGNFYVNATGSPIMVDAVAQKVDGKGNPTSTRFISSGTVEPDLPDSIPVDGVLGEGEYLRFKVRAPKTPVTVNFASARLLYWVG